VDDYGAPSYPSSSWSRRERPQDSLTRSTPTIRPCARVRKALKDPESAEQALLKADPSLRESTVKADFDASAPSFTAAPSPSVSLMKQRLDAWSKWEQKFGITKKRPDVRRVPASN